MHLLDTLQERRHHFFDTLDRMLSNGKPLILVGAGCLGDMTCAFLERQKVKLDSVAVHERYLTDGMTFHGLPVVSVESLIARGERVNYIIALQTVNESVIQALADTTALALVYDPGFIGVNTSQWFTFDYCLTHGQKLDALWQQLGDQQSRDTLTSFLNQRICAKRGHMTSCYEPLHYFPRDIVQLHDDEVFVDCGAYDGDSILAFVRALEMQGRTQARRIVGFEPDAANYQALVENTRHLPVCQCINEGVWSETGELRFSAGNALSSRLSDDGDASTTVRLNTIDNVLKGEPATFIKMDIEGAELAALQGAQETIRRYQPLLAISAYHKPDDLLALPDYIRSLHADYRFFLRSHHPELTFELVLYALPADRCLL